MRILLIGPGKIKEKWLQQGIQEYVKRLSRYVTVKIQEVEDAPDQLPLAEALEREGKQLLRYIPERAYVVALDIKGQQLSSPELAAKLPEWLEQGASQLVFLHGGSRGLAPELLQRAEQRLSFSALTFTHQFSRLLLLEQCYRAFKILRSEPYHK